jgi:hypothetical protein
MEKVSVCVASRGPDMGLWMTLASVVRACPQAELIALVNGREWGEREQLLSDWGATLLHSPEPLIPPLARNECGKKATGDVLVFLDDHVLVGPELFSGICGDVTHFSYTTGPNSPYRYFHFYGIKSMVQGDYRREPLMPVPYRCASGPHGAFAVTRKCWESLGGYWDSYEGFGGEEASFDLYAWSQGFEVWMNPEVQVHHYSARSSARGYEKSIQQANYDMALRRLGADLPRLKARFDSEGIPC